MTPGYLIAGWHLYVCIGDALPILRPGYWPAADTEIRVADRIRPGRDQRCHDLSCSADHVGAPRGGSILSSRRPACASDQSPLHASIIMADVYAGLLPLGIFLLAFARDRMAPWEVVFVFVITCLATLVHYSHLPLAAALAVVALSVLLLERQSPGDILRGAGPCFAAVVVTIAAHVGLQWTLNGTPSISPNGSVFVLARFVEDGPAKTFLLGHCPERHFALCAFVDDMPMNTTRFLWRSDGPMQRLGGAAALRDEAKTIVAGVLREQPVRVAWLAVRKRRSSWRGFGPTATFVPSSFRMRKGRNTPPR